MEESRGEDAKRIGGGVREEEEEEEEPDRESNPSSLFPLFAVPSNPPAALPSVSEPPRWLCNPSFTADVPAAPASSGPAAADASFPPFHDSEGEHEEGEPAGEGGAPPVKATSYDLVASSSPSSEGVRHGRREDRSEGRRRKKKRKRRSESESGRPRDDASRRSLKVPGGYGIKPAKDHYIDVRGDPDNLVYGSLYRMDVVRYKIHNLSESPNLHFQIVYRCQSGNSCIETENDIEVMDNKLKASGRYCSAKNATWLRHKGFKRAKFVGNGKSSVTLQDFIPLSELQMSDERDTSRVTVKREIEESWEDEMLQKTREFNKRTRDYPHDERVWLDFAEFQDKIGSTQPQKAARLQTLEKKISILEKAVELNSDNEELLLCLLNAYRRRDSGDVLIERWAKILMQHSGSHKLWIEFLHVCQEDFSKFKVSGLRKAYAHAIQAVCSACNRLCRQVHQAAESKQADPELVQLEIGLVDIFVNLCRFEWQSGFRELATGLFQAEIEYSLFCPSLLLSSQNKHRLFEHFWNGDGARVGEDGAVGWSGWLAQEEENRQHIVEEDAEEEIEAGGWSGWFEPSSRIEDVTRRPENLAADDGEDGQKEEDLEMEEYHEEEDVEALLKKLGIDVDAEPQTEVKDTATWNRWAKEEISRDSAQWMPVREKSESLHSGDLGRESNEGLSRVILYEDVSDYIFSLSSEEARFHLVSRFIDFFGGQISQWTCTNSASWIENTLGLEEVPDSLIEDLKDASQMATQANCDSSHQSLKFLLGSKPDVSRKAHIMKYLRNAILLCMKIFPRNYILEEALLVAEELCFTHMNSSVGSVTHSRALAKSLLKNDRQDLLLCGIYARREAAYGNIDLARKVFDMALLSISGLPPDLQGNTSLLYFWYADMEMSSFLSIGDAIFSQRSSYILSCLGSNTKYEPFKSQASSLQLLRGRQGFKEQINRLRPLWAHGDIREESIALICSASLLEILTSGWAAGLGIIEEVFSMVLPGYFFNPRLIYGDTTHVDREVLQGTLNVIGRLAMNEDSRMKAELEMDPYRLKTGTYANSQVQYAVGKVTPGRRSQSLQLESLFNYYTGLLQKHPKQQDLSRAWSSILQGLQNYPCSPKVFSVLVEFSSLCTVQHKIRRIFDEYCQRKPSVIVLLFALSFELDKAGSQHRIRGLFERALSNNTLQRSVILWRCYLAYEIHLTGNPYAARRIFYRAIHACPWSKTLWLDGFQKLSSILTAKELSDLQEVMRDKELNLRTDIYEILLEDDI